MGMSTAPSAHTSVARVVAASFIGTALEWYDFFLYGTAAALVFNHLFFPTVDPLAGTIAAFGTYALGFAARPIGGLIFGHFGDRIGRRAMLVATLTLMGAATFLIGVLPMAAGLLIRLKVLETAAFRETRERHKVPALEALRRHPRAVLVSFGARIAENGGSYIFLTFVLAYASKIGIASDVA